MVNFIKNQIIKQGKVSEEAGQAKYKAYFISTHLYEAYRLDVEKALIEEGYETCICNQ